MNLAVIGAGAMGSLFEGLLAEHGIEVTFIDPNEAHINKIPRQKDAVSIFGYL